jgi:RNA polymerase sigma-70 factor (ECF subfamily)
MRVWREARRLDDPRRWRAWLYRIARNAATDAGRSRKRRRLLLDAVFRQQREPGTEHRGPEQRLAAQERHQAMLDAIASLPPLYREPFVLKHLEDWSYQQIGEAMGLPVDTVETRLVRARRLLRERLGAEPPAGARGSVRTRRGSGGHPLRSDR